LEIGSRASAIEMAGLRRIDIVPKRTIEGITFRLVYLPRAP